MRTNLIYLFILGLFTNCGNTEKKAEDCPLGKPTAIFSDTLQQVKSHHFELNGQSSVETILFDSGMELELSQEGCEEILQEFQFKIKDIPDKNKTLSWVEMGVVQFKFLSSLGEQFSPFFMWATAIEDAKERFSMNTPQEIGPGFFVTFNKVPGNDSNILIIKLHTEKR